MNGFILRFVPQDGAITVTLDWRVLCLIEFRLQLL